VKKVGLIVKESAEKAIKKNLKDTDNLFVVNYAKVPSPDLSSLRQNLKNVNAKLFMVQNSVARRALKNTVEGVDKAIDGPCGLIFAKEDPIETCKILYAFLRTHGQFQIQSGFLKDKLLDRKDIEALAKLPTKDQLRAELVAIINSPLSRLTMVLKKNLSTLVYCFQQRKDKAPSAEETSDQQKKEQTPSAEQPEPAPKAEQTPESEQNEKAPSTQGAPSAEQKPKEEETHKNEQIDKTDKTDKAH